MEAMRLGTLPIVAPTGGLKDTVEDGFSDNGMGGTSASPGLVWTVWGKKWETPKFRPVTVVSNSDFRKAASDGISLGSRDASVSGVLTAPVTQIHPKRM